MAHAIKCVCKSQVERFNPITHADSHTTKKKVLKSIFSDPTLNATQKINCRKGSKESKTCQNSQFFVVFICNSAENLVCIFVNANVSGLQSAWGVHVPFKSLQIEFIMIHLRGKHLQHIRVPGSYHWQTSFLQNKHLKQASPVNIHPNSSLWASLVLSKDAMLTSCLSFRDVDRPGQGSRWRDGKDGLWFLMRSFVHSNHQWDEFNLQPGSSLRGILFKTETC